jgi:hypothetical protein
MPKSFTLKEYPNPLYIDAIATHPEIYVGQVEALDAYSYKFNEEDGSIITEYVKTHDFGRYFVKEPDILSCCIMWNKIRATLFAESDYDIDIIGCHQNLLLTLLRNNTNYDITHLEHYCANRDEVLNAITIDETAIKHYNKTNKDNKTKKDIAKSLFTIILYGGTIDTWRSTFYLGLGDIELTPFVKDFIEEIQMNSAIIITDKRFKDIVDNVKANKIAEAKEKYKKRYDTEKFKLKNGAVLSVILQEYETLIIEKSMAFMEEHNCVVTSYNYDGFQIKKVDAIDDLIYKLNTFIAECPIAHNKKIKPFLFENIKFLVKPFREGLDVTKFLVLEGDAYDVKTITKTKNYKLQKKYFEKFHSKIENPYCFIRDDENGLMFIKADKFGSLHCNVETMSYVSEPAREQAKKIFGFASYWTSDKNIRTYYKYDYYPDITLCPKNCYNLWKPYPILKTKLDPNVDTSKITDFMNTLLGDECAKYVLKWFAHVVKHPARKTEVCILLYGSQGCGKSTIGEYILRKIIGLDKMIITSKADKMFGRFVNTQGKLLAVLNEASGKDTFNICDILKDAITCSTTEQEKKGIDAVTITDYTNYIFTTNNINSVKVPEDDRRFMPIQINEDLKGNVEYFKELYADLDNEKIMRKFYDELMAMDLSEFNPSKARPDTELMFDMKNMNRNCIKHFITYWREMLVAPSPVLPCNNVMKKTMSSAELYEHFNHFWTKQGRKEESKPNAIKFSVELKQFKKEVKYKRANGSVFELIDVEEVKC